MKGYVIVGTLLRHRKGDDAVIVQVEVVFTVQHSMDELKDEFVSQGHFPDWQPNETTEAGLVFLETRVVGIDLNTETERMAWFIFSMEACGELRKRIVIPTQISSKVATYIPDLKEFLGFCRNCLVGNPQ